MSFHNVQLLEQALTHTSYANEQKKSSKHSEDNERLEFLGDAVLDLYITEYLYLQFPLRNEGRLAKLKSYVVSAESLAYAARKLDLGKYILLGRGEYRDRGNEKNTVLANVVEAIIGACYLDQGVEIARQLVLTLLKDQIERYQDCNTPQDAKSLLQSYVQKKYHTLPYYEICKIEENQTKVSGFNAELYIEGKYYATGLGNSKKQAEQNAALAALAVLVPEEYC